MKRISAGEFKTRCLALMDDVNASGEALLITKRGKAVAQLVPVKRKRKSSNFLNRLRGKIQVIGDITDPAVPLEDWTQE